MVGFNDTEIIIGLAAKQGRIRNRTNTIINNKRYIAGDPVSTSDSPVTVLEKDGKWMYQVDFKDKDYYISPEKVLEHLYSYMHDIAASHCANVDESETVLTVPLGFNQNQRETVQRCATQAGFRVGQVCMTFINCVV